MTTAHLALLVPFALPLQDEAPDPSLGEELAAVAGEYDVTFEELDEALIWRHGRSTNGREALRSLLDLVVLDHLAEERGVEVGPEEIAARWGELERELQEGGHARDLLEYLEQQDIEPETFREHLRLSIVHEELTRRALDLGPDDQLTGEQQTRWLEKVHASREVEEEPHPWEDGVVARSGELEITRAAFAEHLRTLVPREELRELAHGLALEKALRDRMPDLAESAVREGIEAELGRRAARVEADPRFQGVEYERLLDAQGLSLEAMRRDPSVRVHALSHLWSERTLDGETLRDTYEAEREAFDARHGEAVDVYALLLQAARFENEVVPRTFEKAEEELAKLRESIEGLEDFQRLASQHSEEPRTRERGGHLGRVTAGNPVVPEPIRRATFQAVEAARGEDGEVDVEGTVLGPVRVQGGTMLLCLGERHPAPTWEEMSRHVANELRRRMRDELLPPQEVALWFDR